MPAPILLHIPNEHADFQQMGFRGAFSQLRNEGVLSGVHTYSLLAEVEAGRAGSAHSEVLALAQETRPEVILFQHVDGMQVTHEWLKRLRTLCPGATIVYDEGDAYGRGKPLPSDARILADHADLIFVRGRGKFLMTFPARRGDTHYVPHAWDQARFSAQLMSGSKRGAVMVANNVRSRIPFKSMPGARHRTALATSLANRPPHARTDLFGRGWRLPIARGYLPYDRQKSVISSYAVSANWDYFDHEAGYFSDRLPISLLAGSPHVTNWHPGYEWLPSDENGLFLCRSTAEALEIMDSLVGTPASTLSNMCRPAAGFAKKHLSQYNVARFILRTAGVHVPQSDDDFPWAQ